MYDMAVDLTPVFAVVVVLVSLALSIKPVKNLGILNYIVGLIGIIIGLLSVAEESLPYTPWFGVLVVLLSLVCLLRGTSVEIG